MGLSINPADIWKMFSAGKARNKEEIAKWLDTVATDARQLAEAWKDVCVALSAKGSEAEMQRVVDSLRKKHGYFLPNRSYFARLDEFYRNASGVLGDRVNEKVLQYFVSAAGEMMVARSSANDIYHSIFKQYLKDVERYEKNGRRMGFIDDRSSMDDLTDLDRAAEVMDREAAALEVLA